jgi:hypothetical protein
VKIYAHPTQVSTAFACFSSYSSVVDLAMTTDDGASWTDVTGDLPNFPVHGIAIHPAQPNDWYIATDLGVWHSGDGGATWLPYATGLPNVVVDDIEVKESTGKLVAGTHGRGAWEVDLGLVGLGAEVDVAEGAVPRNLMFDEPWPNPATDRTLLRYAAKSSAAVTLRIYDVRGRLVSDLEGFARGDGIIRTTPWFPDDVPSGVYLAVLEAGGERVTRKITVLK